jgi:hypothetical protein
MLKINNKGLHKKHPFFCVTDWVIFQLHFLIKEAKKAVIKWLHIWKKLAGNAFSRP